MPSVDEIETQIHYRSLGDEKNSNEKLDALSDPEHPTPEAGGLQVQKKQIRSAKKRADIQTTIRERSEAQTEPAGRVWACCLGSEILFPDLLKSTKYLSTISPCMLRVENTYSEVFFCKCFSKHKTCFIFRFGCIVAWDVEEEERNILAETMHKFVKEPLGPRKEDDYMTYIWSDRAAIRGDNIHLVTSNIFECLAYSYAFAQSVKLAVFEAVVDDNIERTKNIPEGLADTGKISSTREEIGRRIGELFVNRFYINLHTDILDTPDIFWDNDDFAEHYDNCRRYLEIPKRVDILNQRLDIIKDLYDMLNNELTIQHGYKLEWIVIYLICIEVLIEVVWNIIIKDVFKWV